MSAAPIAALFFTVVMLVTTAYFLMGSVPLLILKHGTPLDARFVRDFFDTFYRAAMVTASASAGGRCDRARAAGRPPRRKIIPAMDSFRAQIQDSEASAIQTFRRIHIAAVVVNLAQLVANVWSLIAVSMSLR
jgi:hypothetical protein